MDWLQGEATLVPRRDIEALDIAGVIPKPLRELFAREVRARSRAVEHHNTGDVVGIFRSVERDDHPSKRSSEKHVWPFDPRGGEERVEVRGDLLSPASLVRCR